jgi:hypothetical protein
LKLAGKESFVIPTYTKIENLILKQYDGIEQPFSLVLK